MRYRVYVIGKAENGEEEIISKRKYDLLDEAIRGIKELIPHQVSRKEIEMIIIKREED